jgi:hypothetical protein
MEPTPVDSRIQNLFEKMADEYAGEISLISWDSLRKEAILHLRDESGCEVRTILALKEFLRCVGDNGLSEETLIEVHPVNLVGGEWLRNSWPKVVVSMLPSAVLAIISR